MAYETKSDWPQHSVENALLQMSSVDQDYARSVNGIGFSKLDTEFGNSLAEKLGKWGHLTYRQSRAAYKMLRKYRGQLLKNWGISYDLIPEPVENEPTATKVKGTVWLHDGTLIVDSPYNGALVNALRVVPTRRWEKDGSPASKLGQKGVWVVPITIDNISVVRKLVADFDLEMEPDAKKALEQGEEELEALVGASGATESDVEVPAGLGITPLPFQRAALAYARKVLDSGGLYIADEMGLGKTIETLMIAEDRGAFPMLVAVPKVVWVNWARECRKVLPGRSVAMLAPTTVTKSMMRVVPEGVRVITLAGDEDENTTRLFRNRAEGEAIVAQWHDIYIVSYNNLLKWSDALLEVPWKLVAYDEAHLLKTRKAQRTKAAQKIAKLAEAKLALSGTPIPNAPSELISQINLLDRMADLGGFKRFWWRYCNGWDRGHSNEGELNAKMRSTFYLRRLKRDVYPELPEVRWIDVPVEMANPERYDQTEADMMAYIREQVANSDEIAKLLAEIDEADRAAARKELVDQKYQAHLRAQVLTLINALRNVVAQEKLPAMYDWLDGWLETTTGNGHSLQGEASQKIVVFTDHRDIAKAVAHRYNNRDESLLPLIIGGMDAGKKDRLEQDFLNQPEPRVLVCQIQAAGLGLTLTSASNVAFFEYPWRPMDMDQGVSRTYGRVNDLHGATAYQLFTPDTIDTKMLDKIADKRDTTGKVQDGGSVMGAVLRDLIRGVKEEA